MVVLLLRPMTHNIWDCGFINQDVCKGFQVVSLVLLCSLNRVHDWLLFITFFVILRNWFAHCLAGASSTTNNALLLKGGMNVFIKDPKRCPPICLRVIQKSDNFWLPFAAWLIDLILLQRRMLWLCFGTIRSFSFFFDSYILLYFIFLFIRLFTFLFLYPLSNFFRTKLKMPKHLL